MKNKTFLIISVSLLVLAQAVSASAITVFVNGDSLNTQPSAYIDEQDRTMIPLRAVSENLEKEVNWVQETEEVLIEDLILQIGNKEAVSDGRSIQMDTAPAIREGRTFVPLRFVSESLGYEVEYQADRGPRALIWGKDNETRRLNDPYDRIAHFPNQEVIKRTAEIMRKMDSGVIDGSLFNKNAWSSRINIMDEAVNQAALIAPLEAFYIYQWRLRDSNEGIVYSPYRRNSREDHLQVMQEIEAKANQITDSSMSEKEKVRAVTDFILGHVSYASGRITADYSDHVTAWQEGLAQCAGYSMLAQAFFDILGIDSIIVKGQYVTSSGRGGNHGWNLVRVDNEWLHLDITSMDGRQNTENRGAEFFLVGHSSRPSELKWDKDFYQLN